MRRNYEFVLTLCSVVICSTYLYLVQYVEFGRGQLANHRRYRDMEL